MNMTREKLKKMVREAVDDPDPSISYMKWLLEQQDVLINLLTIGGEETVRRGEAKISGRHYIIADIIRPMKQALGHDD